MSDKECHLRQVHHVLAGLTADGNPSAKLSFPSDAARRQFFEDWATCILQRLEGYHLDEVTRTVLLRKLAAHLNRIPLDNESLSLNCWHAMDFFSLFPEKITTRLSFAGAARLMVARKLSLDEDGRTVNDRMHQKQMETYIVTVPAPPLMPIWQLGYYRMHELVHPMHLQDAGRFANNCLKGPRLANYWDLIRNNKRQVFALWHADRLAFLFTVNTSFVVEFEFVDPPSDILDVLRPSLEAVETASGPVVLRRSLRIAFADISRREAPGGDALRDALQALSCY